MGGYVALAFCEKYPERPLTAWCCSVRRRTPIRTKRKKTACGKSNWSKQAKGRAGPRSSRSGLRSRKPATNARRDRRSGRTGIRHRRRRDRSPAARYDRSGPTATKCSAALRCGSSSSSVSTTAIFPRKAEALAAAHPQASHRLARTFGTHGIPRRTRNHGSGPCWILWERKTNQNPDSESFLKGNFFILFLQTQMQNRKRPVGIVRFTLRPTTANPIRR